MMGGLFQFTQEEILSFFAVLVRFSILLALVPIFGDRFIPGPAKVLLSVAVSAVIFPALVARGVVRPADAAIWGSSVGGIIYTIAIEALVGLSIGFVSRIVFDSIHFGASLTGNYMGFAAAATFDPHQETQTQVIAEIQMTIAMLLFLSLDGHHLMLRAALDSYRLVGLGSAEINQIFSNRLIQMTGELIRYGVQLSAPVGLSIFTVNVAFGVLAKTMPQLNVLVLSFAASALMGLAVFWLSLSEFQGVTVGVFAKTGDWIQSITAALGGR